MNNEPYGLITSSGAEATSDDRELKYILRREISFSGPIENEVYTSYCYVRSGFPGTGWQKTTNTMQYPSVRAFVKAVAGFPGFTKATNELEKGGEQ